MNTHETTMYPDLDREQLEADALLLKMGMRPATPMTREAVWASHGYKPQIHIGKVAAQAAETVHQPGESQIEAKVIPLGSTMLKPNIERAPLKLAS